MSYINLKCAVQEIFTVLNFLSPQPFWSDSGFFRPKNAVEIGHPSEVVLADDIIMFAD